MNLILEKYNSQLMFSSNDNSIINSAIELGWINTEDLIEDFWEFRDLHFISFTDIDSELVLDFNEHYDNGLTHTENFINLLRFLN